MNTFAVNKKTYNAKPFDFNMVCDLEDMGIQLSEAGTKQIKLIRAYFALCAGITQEEAGKEIEAHVIATGKMVTELSEAMNKELENSDFFQALNKTAEKEAQTNEK